MINWLVVEIEKFIKIAKFNRWSLLSSLRDLSLDLIWSFCYLLNVLCNLKLPKFLSKINEKTKKLSIIQMNHFEVIRRHFQLSINIYVSFPRMTGVSTYYLSYIIKFYTFESCIYLWFDFYAHQVAWIWHKVLRFAIT